MKAKFTIDSIGRVTISYDDETLDGVIRVERTFTCPEDGGYVREYLSNGELKQVCDRLASMGSTLMCSSRADLPALIRREYRALRRFEKRYD